MAWPGFIETLDRDRDDRSLRVNRENRGALAEHARVAVIGALALRIENQNESMVQAKGSGAHGRYQVRVRIDDDHAQPSCQPPHESSTENVARAHRKALAKQSPRERPRHHQRIDIALVIRTDQVLTVVGQIFQSANLEVKAVEREKINQPA